MIFSLHVLAGPYSQQSNLTALRFCQAALARQHSIKRVFFSGDGVFSASALAVTPQDEVDLFQQWQALAVEHGIELTVCISAGLRRGMIDQAAAKRYEKPAANVAPQFTISGLGQLVEAGLESDRLITFGN